MRFSPRIYVLNNTLDATLCTYIISVYGIFGYELSIGMKTENEKFVLI